MSILSILTGLHRWIIPASQKAAKWLWGAMIAVWDFVKKVDWRVWAILAAILTVAFLWFFIKGIKREAAEKERELLAELVLAQGQVEIYEGLWFSRAIEEEIRLSELHGEDSRLTEVIDERIEAPVASTEIRTVFRDRIVYVSEPSQRSSEGEVRVEIESGDDSTEAPEGQNHIVDFDLTEQGFRIRGQTQSLGARVRLELEQVDPFNLGIVLTRQRRGGEMNIFVEDLSGLLDVEVGHFVFNDLPPERTPFRSRVGVGAVAGVSASSIDISAIATFDVGRATLMAGPSVSASGDALYPGAVLGLTFRPFR